MILAGLSMVLFNPVSDHTNTPIICSNCICIDIYVFVSVLQFSLDTDSAANQGDASRKAGQQRLRQFTFNMETGAVSQRVVSDVFGDFPSIPRHLAGERQPPIVKCHLLYACTVILLCNDCFGYQETSPYIELSLLRGTTAVRMQ